MKTFQPSRYSGKQVSLERARQVAKEEGIKYTDEELQVIIEYVLMATEITTSHYKRLREQGTKTITLPTISTDEAKSISIHSSEYRRAS